ncbi:MAG: Kdo2-lipid lauroyltransferase [Chloroflexi bacterium]|nr:Kdo2-lipid lauroyltransferase [Chloroflexota bacterium]
MGVIELAASPRAAVMAARLVKALPTGMALRAADILARRAASQVDSPVVRALRHNQAVVRGLPIDDPRLDQAALTALQITARGYVHLFKNLGKPTETLRSCWKIDDDLVETINSYRERGQGVFYTGIHTAGFDQVLITLGTYGYPVMGLSYADPTAIYRFQNQVRINSGVTLLEISSQSLRQALRFLRQGNVVFTGCDRPDPKGENLIFFGRKARLPVGHARLALHANAPIIAGATCRTGEGTYRASLVGVFEPEKPGGNDHFVIDLAQRIISAFEVFLSQHADEWLMFFPVWDL